MTAQQSGRTGFWITARTTFFSSPNRPDCLWGTPGRTGFWITTRTTFFSSPNRPDYLWGTPDLLFSGYRGYVLGVKLPGRGVDHSRPSRAEVKKYYSSCSSPLTQCLHAVDRGSLTLLPLPLISKQRHCLAHVFIPSRLIYQNKWGICGFRTFQFVKLRALYKVVIRCK